MSFFDYSPSCSHCEYATLYIPYFSFPYDDPYCSKGHGKCKVNKVCDDYKLINSHWCCECKYFTNQIVSDNFCKKKNIEVDMKQYSCVYFEKKEFLRNSVRSDY